MPLDCIVGGPAMAGQGWRMLVEQLSVGRCISLPSNATGSAKAAVLATGAYARVRRQFNLPIARFEGIEAVIARMTGLTLHHGCRPLRDRRRHRRWREALGALRHAQIPRHGDESYRRQRRHGCARRQGHLPRAQQLPGPQLPDRARGDHRGRGQYPHAQSHHLRSGRDPLPSLCFEGDGGGAQSGRAGRGGAI